jgi:hypothetical protein
MSAVCMDRHLPPQLNIHSEDFSGEGLFTHTSTYIHIPPRGSSDSIAGVLRNIENLRFAVAV